jgi:hypothetical protein
MTHFEHHKLTDDERRILREFSRKPWAAKFHKSVQNETAPGGVVDMYILLDDDSGEQTVSIAVPNGEAALASWIAACCARPWFVEHTHDGKVLGDIAIAFNRALRPFMDKNGDLDARDVGLACLSIFQAYVGELPKYARDELVHRVLVALNELMRAEA